MANWQLTKPTLIAIRQYPNCMWVLNAGLALRPTETDQLFFLPNGTTI